MKTRLVMIPSIAKPLTQSPGFVKKELSDYKLDIMGLCGFGCSYCSSNAGNYLRINRERFADATEKQFGERVYPADDPGLTFEWPDVLDNLRKQVEHLPRTWGAGKTVVFSMLTDGFSPRAVADGTTEAALRVLLGRTALRIRVLTKSAVVGTSRWIDFFGAHPGRFVVGLSTGTLDDDWAHRVEMGTSSPSARIRALHALQDAGVPTFGMLCPVFPDAADDIGDLLKAIRPERCERVWSEPYNDRTNWRAVQAGYSKDAAYYGWFDDVFARGDHDLWSLYATRLYQALIASARHDGWADKLRYLLYEDRIAAMHAPVFAGLEGVLLQSKPGEDGRSRNSAIATLQGKG